MALSSSFMPCPDPCPRRGSVDWDRAIGEVALGRCCFTVGSLASRLRRGVSALPAEPHTVVPLVSADVW